MSSAIKYKWTVRFVIVLAIMPVLFGNAFHCLTPGTHGSHSSGEPSAYCSHGEEHENETSTPQNSCSTCDFLAMPCDVVPTVTEHCILDLVERHEPEPVQAFVILYRPFEPGRAPPTVV